VFLLAVCLAYFDPEGGGTAIFGNICDSKQQNILGDLILLINSQNPVPVPEL
jgi:hypothetical protein